MWNKKYKQCTKCKTTDHPYYARGMCSVCYNKNYWDTKPEFRKKHKKLVYHWRDTHLERWKEIQKKASKKQYKNYVINSKRPKKSIKD